MDRIAATTPGQALKFIDVKKLDPDVKAATGIPDLSAQLAEVGRINFELVRNLQDHFESKVKPDKKGHWENLPGEVEADMLRELNDTSLVIGRLISESPFKPSTKLKHVPVGRFSILPSHRQAVERKAKGGVYVPELKIGARENSESSKGRSVSAMSTMILRDADDAANPLRTIHDELYLAPREPGRLEKLVRFLPKRVQPWVGLKGLAGLYIARERLMTRAGATKEDNIAVNLVHRSPEKGLLRVYPLTGSKT